MSRKKITIGIVIPCLNEEKNIHNCASSLYEQKNYIEQLVFIDDHSSDNSVNEAKKAFKNFKNFLLIKNKQNLGGLFIANKAIDFLKTDYVLFLSSNDVAHKSYIKDVFEILNNSSHKPGIITALCNTVENNKSKIHNSPILSYKNKILSPSECDKYSMMLGNWITGPTTIFKTKLLKNMGGFNIDYYGLSDLFLSIHLASQSGAIFIPYVYGNFTIHKGFLYKTLTSKKTMTKILDLLENDNRSFIFNKLNFKRKTKYRIIFTSLNSNISTFNSYIKYLPLYKNIFLRIINHVRHRKLKTLLLFIILRPFDIYPFLKYRYYRHFIHRFLLKKNCTHKNY